MCVYNLSNIYIYKHLSDAFIRSDKREKKAIYTVYVTKKENNIYGILVFTVIYDLFIYYKFHLIYH